MRTAPNCRRPGRTCFSELETSKGGSDIIDCLRRAHIAALSLELLGISHHGTDLESRSHGLSEGTAGCRKPRRRVARGSPFRPRIHRHWLSAACQIRGARWGVRWPGEPDSNREDRSCPKGGPVTPSAAPQKGDLVYVEIARCHSDPISAPTTFSPRTMSKITAVHARQVQPRSWPPPCHTRMTHAVRARLPTADLRLARQPDRRVRHDHDRRHRG